MSRISTIATRIRRVSGSRFWVEKVDHIQGEGRQAAAYPDGKVEVTRELVNALNDDELAWVISHEVAHIRESHSQRREQGMETARAVVNAGMRATNQAMKYSGMGIVGRLAGTLAAAVVGSSVATLSVLKQSRNHERQADEEALELTARAGYDPGAAVTAYEKLCGGAVPATGAVDNLLSTHPAPRDRWARLRNRSEQ